MIEEGERTVDFFEGPGFLSRFSLCLGAAGIVTGDASTDIGEAGVVAAESRVLIEEKAAVVFAVFGDELGEGALRTEDVFLRGEGGLQLEIGSLKLDPAGRAVVNAGVGGEVVGVTMAAAHENADAVVGAGKDELGAAGAEAFRAAAAESVAERVQAHGNEFEIDAVLRAGEDVLKLASEDLAGDGFEMHKSGYLPLAPSF